MKKKSIPAPPAADLRRRAEERFRGQPADVVPGRTQADMQRLVHELQVHQIELEMQNDELQLTRDRLEDGLEKYTDLYDFAPVGFLTINMAGTIQEVNLAAASLLGIERSKLLQQRLSTYVAVEDLAMFNALLDQVYRGETRGFCELMLVSGHTGPTAVRIEMDAGPSGQDCRVVLVDISVHKRAEQDRLTLNKLEATGILAGGIAHDFNNLLTVILLDIEQAQLNAPPVDASAPFLTEARKAALSARSLTQQLITFSEGGAPVRRVTPLSAVIQESIRLPLSGSQVRCELSLAPDLWSANVDEGQIGQVIRNLVLNAREAISADGMISVRAENVVVGPGEIPPLAPGDYVRLRVSDQGCGMTDEVRAKIFDPYFSTKQRGKEKGMGLGLTICHSIVEKHGGAIGLTSKVGVGTTFLVHLPACRDDAGAMPAAVATTASAPVRILVMDDEGPVRKTIGVTLRHMGHEVEAVSDGQSAIERYRQAVAMGRRFDLVFLDLTIRGGMGAKETLRVLRELDPNVKAIVMSGYAEDVSMREPERHGFTDVLAKPFDGDKLRGIVARAMADERKRKAAS